MEAILEELIDTHEKLCAEKHSIKEILNHTSLPEYFGSENKDWMPGAWSDSNWIQDTIRIWYRFSKRKLKSRKPNRVQNT